MSVRTRHPSGYKPLAVAVRALHMPRLKPLTVERPLHQPSTVHQDRETAKWPVYWRNGQPLAARHVAKHTTKNCSRGQTARLNDLRVHLESEICIAVHVHTCTAGITVKGFQSLASLVNLLMKLSSCSPTLAVTTIHA